MTAMPRGCGPRWTLETCRIDATSTMLKSYEHQLATSNRRPSGVVARYFGVLPTSTTPSIFFVARSTRYTYERLRELRPGQLSLPSGLKPLPYIA